MAAPWPAATSRSENAPTMPTTSALSVSSAADDGSTTCLSAESPRRPRPAARPSKPNQQRTKTSRPPAGHRESSGPTAPRRSAQSPGQASSSAADGPSRSRRPQRRRGSQSSGRSIGAPTRTGDSSAPISPTPAIACPAQRIASAVARAPTSSDAIDSRQRRDHAVDVRADDDRREQAGRRGSDHHDRGLGASPLGVQPDARGHQEARADPGECDSSLDSDPSARNRERQEQDDPRQRGRPAGPGEHTPAKEIAQRVVTRTERRQRTGGLRTLGVARA